MTELLLPRLKQEIETRLAELRPLIAEIDQLEAAKAALLARAELPTAIPAPARRRAPRNGAPARRRAAAAPSAPKRAEGDGERAPRGANRDAIVKLVEERPGVSVAEIASVTKIAKPTVATTVSKLKREGVFADEAGGVKLASRQAMTISGTAAEQPAAPSE
ncbi:MAG TPA: winged helix-turn-helix transcriptional regulator, partial [Conexibacter sp.]|nr:winged helix-turn-helix transcriptional regulator [Conexibacter sp.]